MRVKPFGANMAGGVWWMNGLNRQFVKRKQGAKKRGVPQDVSVGRRLENPAGRRQTHKMRLLAYLFVKNVIEG